MWRPEVTGGITLCWCEPPESSTVHSVEGDPAHLSIDPDSGLIDEVVPSHTDE